MGRMQFTIAACYCRNFGHYGTKVSLKKDRKLMENKQNQTSNCGPCIHLNNNTVLNNLIHSKSSIMYACGPLNYTFQCIMYWAEAMRILSS